MPGGGLLGGKKREMMVGDWFEDVVAPVVG